MPATFAVLDQNLPRFHGGESLEERVRVLQDYQYQLLEQLRYILSHLDTRNFNMTEINSWAGTITEPVYGRIADAEGNITQLEITAKGIQTQVSDNQGNISQLQQTATQLSSRISDNAGNISTLQQTATRLSSQISDNAGNISTLQQTATRLSSQISDNAGNISTLQQTAAQLSSRISDSEGNISVLQQTARSLESTVAGQAGDISQIRQDMRSISLSVVNEEGYSTIQITGNGIRAESQTIEFQGMVSFTDLSNDYGRTIINGGIIDTRYLRLDSLYGETIYLMENENKIAAMLTLQGASSTLDRKLKIISGAMELSTWSGDLYFSAGSGGAVQIGSREVAVTGDLIPNSSDRYSCGTYSFPWSDIYSTDGTVSSSDGRGKEDIDYDMGRYSRFFDSLRPCSFLRKSGRSGRRHHGLIAQDVAAALDASGLTAKDFAGYVQWGDGETEGCGLRYEELIAMLIYEVQALKKSNGEERANGEH